MKMLGLKGHINTFNLLLVIFVALGTLSTAYGLAIIGSTVGQPNCRSCNSLISGPPLILIVYLYFKLAAAPGQPGYAHTTTVIAALNGANSGGAFLGCFLCAWAADRYGRKVSPTERATDRFPWRSHADSYLLLKANNPAGLRYHGCGRRNQCRICLDTHVCGRPCHHRLRLRHSSHRCTDVSRRDRNC